MGKYTRLFSLPARHRVRINIGPSSYRRAPAAAIVRGTLYAARAHQPTYPGREVAPPMRQHSGVIFCSCYKEIAWN